MTGVTKLNAVQLHLLELFSGDMSDQELSDIKKILKDYYAKRVDDDMDALWEEKGWSEGTIDQ
ncbi:MAG: hypothetical protein WA958_11875 [Tunicatimonas sp.]